MADLGAHHHELEDGEKVIHAPDVVLTQQALNSLQRTGYILAVYKLYHSIQ
jgi:hypothetical protein